MAERRTYADRRNYLIDAVRKRRKTVRYRALTYKGGRCQRCSYDRCMEALEFHHLTSTKKDFGISSKGYTRSWEKIRAELDKCVLLCAICHREVHSSLQPPRETVVELRVNSGKPAPIPRRIGMGILSEACRRVSV
jgi:5-methylcytosine-specific restriction endonuclease McrA